MVLPDRIELSTSPLPMECSTTELRQHARYLRGIGLNGRPLGGRFLPQGPLWRKHAGRPEWAQNRQKCWACCRQAASTRSNRREPPKDLPTPAVPDHPWPTFGVPESSPPAALWRHGSLRWAAAKPTMLV